MSNSKDQSAHIDLPSNLKSNYIDCVLIPAAALYQPRATNPENAMWQLSPLGFSAITPFLPVYPSLSFSPSLIDTPLEHQMSSNHRKKKSYEASSTNDCNSNQYHFCHRHSKSLQKPNQKNWGEFARVGGTG